MQQKAELAPLATNQREDPVVLSSQEIGNMYGLAASLSKSSCRGALVQQ